MMMKGERSAKRDEDAKEETSRLQSKKAKKKTNIQFKKNNKKHRQQHIKQTQIAVLFHQPIKVSH